MKWFRTTFLMSFVLILLAACNHDSDQLGQDSQQIVAEIHNSLKQQSFRFDGTASLRGDNYSHENMVSFTGIVGKDQHTYLNLKTAKEENGVMEDMDLYAKGNQLYLRFADQVDWEPVGEKTSLIEMELNHWNPTAHFERMQTMSKEVEYVGRKANIETIRVVLDEEALKNDFLNNIRSRLEEGDTLGKKDLFKSLSTGQAGEQGVMEEINGFYNTLQQDFEDLARSVRISGHYTIHYDKDRKLPTQVFYVQTTDYTQDGKNETEISETEITFTRYGEELIPTNLP